MIIRYLDPWGKLPNPKPSSPKDQESRLGAEGQSFPLPGFGLSGFWVQGFGVWGSGGLGFQALGFRLHLNPLNPKP